MASNSFTSTSKAAEPGRTRGLPARALRSGVVALLCVAYGLIFAEGFIRLLDPQSLMPRYITGTAWGVRGNIPNARYHHTTPETAVDFRINAQGMRSDRDAAIAKPPNTCRIELFGDSFFMGYELNIEDTFARRIEQLIQARGVNVEVLNLAVSGFSTAEMLRTYEKFGAQFEPDLVLFSWHSSDFAENGASNLYRIAGQTLEEDRATYLPSVQLQDRLMGYSLYRWLVNNSHLYSFARETASRLFKGLVATYQRLLRPALDQPAAAAPKGSDSIGFLTTPYNTALSAALLEQARAEIAAHQAGFALVEIPFRLTNQILRSSANLLPPELWRTILRVNPTEPMQAVNTPSDPIYYKRGQGHFTPKGTDLLANVTIDALWDSQPFARCRAVGKRQGSSALGSGPRHPSN